MPLIILWAGERFPISIISDSIGWILRGVPVKRRYFAFPSPFIVSHKRVETQTKAQDLH